MGQFGSKGGLRRIVPIKSDRNRPKAVLLNLPAPPKVPSQGTPAGKTA
jgi:hypothetical protein